MWRFLKNLLKHPGSWVLLSLIFVTSAIGAVPATAAALAVLAFAAIALATIALVPYLIGFYRDGRGSGGYIHLYNHQKAKKLSLGSFAEAHPWQALAMGFAVAGFITALILTIGFFSGVFPFMAPVFIGLASPFMALNSSLFTPAIAVFLFLIAPLAIGNNLKRLLAWADSFKDDAVHQKFVVDAAEDSVHKKSLNSRADYRAKAKESSSDKDYLEYCTMLSYGVFVNAKNGFSSPYAEAKEATYADAMEAKEATSKTLTAAYVHMSGIRYFGT